MEYANNTKKLASCRYSHRVHTYEPLMPHPKSNASNVELLEKILQNLPESQRVKVKKFQTIIRQNSHSPDTSHRIMLRKVTWEPAEGLNKRLRTHSGHNLSHFDVRHIENKICEIDLKNIGQDPYMFNLFIGDLAAANDGALLLKHSIHGIINVGECNEPEKFSSVSNGYFCVMKHKENFVWEAIKAAFKPLDIMLSKGNTMIQCKDGSLYAPVLAIAFLIKRFGIGYNDALGKVCQSHTKAFIHNGFVRELKHLERVSIGIS